MSSSKMRKKVGGLSRGGGGKTIVFLRGKHPQKGRLERHRREIKLTKERHGQTKKGNAGKTRPRTSFKGRNCERPANVQDEISLSSPAKKEGTPVSRAARGETPERKGAPHRVGGKKQNQVVDLALHEKIARMSYT